MKAQVSAALLKLPATPMFDRLHSLPMFWVAHRRLPRRGSGLFNDHLYFLKTRLEEDPARDLRRYVSDKEQAKDYARKMLGDDLAPQTLALFDHPDDITVGMRLPPCVIKATHLGGGRVIYHPGGALGADGAAEARRWFTEDIYRDMQRERNYKGLPHRVLCEEVIADSKEIRDYRFHCWRGEPRVIGVDIGSPHEQQQRRFYTTDWTPLPFKVKLPLAAIEAAPSTLDEMVRVVRKLAAPFGYVRVDLYAARGRIWIGELTNCHAAAHARFQTIEEERAFSSIIFSEG